MIDPTKTTIEYVRGLFARLEEFFERATGKSATGFATVADFGDVIRKSAHEIAPRCQDAYTWLDTEVRTFQARRGLDAFAAAKQLGGMKLVLGGGSRFLGSQLSSVATAILYSDSVFIPDPVMPWLERDRSEEKYKHVLLLQAIHTLLHLKPLVDAELNYPPVVVFPSWEKLLEDHDQQTQQGISQLIADVISNYVAEPLTNLEEARDYANRHPERFCDSVDQNHLFIAPGGPLDEPLTKAITRYERENEKWRSQDWHDIYKRLPKHIQVLYGITERISPLYHLFENADEFRAHPLLCQEQHAHYFKIVSHTSNARLEKMGLLDPKTTALVNALGSRRLRWLGSISADVLAKLRQDGENRIFRERLSAAVGRLHEAVLDDIDQVAAEVCHEIDSMLTEHEKKLRQVQEKYDRIHGQTALLALAATMTAVIPALAPLLGSTAPLALAAKYGYNKIAELADKRELTRSVVGVLAAAKSDQK